MRPHGQTKLGFFPLPVAEAKRLKNWLTFPERFSAVDPCVGDGVAFAHLLRDLSGRRYGFEIDANRAEQAKALGIETLHANTTDVRCQPEAVSLLYLNPPYDREAGESNNQRFGSCLLGTHVSLAQARWCTAVGGSPGTIDEVREVAERAFHRFAALQTHRIGVPAIQADRGSGGSPQTACPADRCSAMGCCAIPRNAGNKD